LAWIFNILLVFTFPLLNAHISWFILAGVCAVAWCVVFFRIPETKAVDSEAAKLDNEAITSEDEVKIELSSNKRVCACAFVAILSGAMYGYQTCIISGLSKPLMNESTSPYNLSGMQDNNGTTAKIYTSILTSEILVGGMVGSFIGPIIADKCGRKVGITITAIFGLIPSVVLALVPIYWVAIGARTIQGVGVGMSCTVAPLYVNEVAPIKKRGALGTLFQIAICASILVGEFMNFILQPNSRGMFDPAWKWQVQFGGSIVFSLLLLLYSIIAMPESPSWQTKQRLNKQVRDKTTSLLDNDYMGEVEYGSADAGDPVGLPKVPSKADMLETPRGMEWKTTTSWEDVRKAAEVIKKSFTDLTKLDDIQDGE
jgi:predicted MFS family arabinose efflux permease